MANKLIERLVGELSQLGSQIILTEDPHGFFSRKDTQSILKNYDFLVIEDLGLSQRITFELRADSPEKKFLFITKEWESYLEDIQKNSSRFHFLLADYLFGYHMASVLACPLQVIEEIYNDQPLTALSKAETLRRIGNLKSNEVEFDIDSFKQSLQSELDQANISWFSIIQLVSTALSESIGTESEHQVIDRIETVNTEFQNELSSNYSQLPNSNAIERPKVVSKVLDHINGQRNEKDALVVLDGLAYWQYFLLKDEFQKFGLVSNESHTYSWIPSITQLSRQAIFRGSAPVAEYIQGPRNEEKLFRQFWQNENVLDHQIGYFYGEDKIDEQLSGYSKLAWVMKDFDDIMHSSPDYKEVLIRTKHRIDKLKLCERMLRLVHLGFTVHLTTDHGSIQTKPWRKLKGRENLTHRSGSKSMRHVEYESSSTALKFINENPELKDSVSQQENMIYFTNNQCFDSKSIVTHGGSHMLETIIPLIKISKES